MPSRFVDVEPESRFVDVPESRFVDPPDRFVDAPEEIEAEGIPLRIDDTPTEDMAKDAARTIENISMAYPVVETAGNLATMTYGLPLSGLAGLAGLATGSLERAGRWQEAVAKALIYNPQTKRGGELTEATFYPFEKLSGVGKVAEEKLDEAGHPIIGTIAKTLIEASPALVLGPKALRKTRTKQAPALNESLQAERNLYVKEQFEKKFLGEEIVEASQVDDGTVLYGGIPIHEAGGAWIKNVGEPVWNTLVMDKGVKLLEKVPGGKAVNRALIYDYRGDLPNTGKYISSMEAKKTLQYIGREYAIDLGNRLTVMPEKAQLQIGEFLRGELAELPQDVLPVAQEARSVLMELGQQAVEAGLLDEATFFKNIGRYMPRLYESKEYQTKLTNYGYKAPSKLDLSRFKQRKDIPKEVREQMGEILTPAYPVAKGVTQLTHDIATARFFNGIIANREWALPRNTELAIPEGWKQLPSDSKLGKLKGAYVHPEILADMRQTIRIRSQSEMQARKALGLFKYGKVVISPKTHARNLQSNSVLAHLGGLPMWEQPKYLSKAAAEMRGRGKHWQKITAEGGLEHTFAEGELKALFDKVEDRLEGATPESMYGRFTLVDRVWKKTQKAGKKASDLYQAEEMWFKTAKYIHNVEKKGMTPREAWLDAEKWLFNYSKVTKFQEAYRGGTPVGMVAGAPFATFTFKALPRIAEATIKTPWRLATPAAVLYGLERASSALIGDTKDMLDAKKELRQDYMKGSFLGIPNFVRVPLVDDEGIGGGQREYYYNATYTMPWGDIGESGGWFGIPGSLQPFSMPFSKELIEQKTNFDWFWKKPIVKETDTVGKDKIPLIGITPDELGIRAEHAARTFLPTPVIDVTKAMDAILNKPDYMGRFRNPVSIASDVIAGIKMYPVDYDEQFAKQVGTLHPKDGYLARRITSEIRTLAIKKNAVEEKGGDGSSYQRQIEKKVEQLKGLGKKMKETGEIYKQAMPSR